MKSNTPLLDEITDTGRPDLHINATIENNAPAIITTTTGLKFTAELLRADSRKGTALLRRDNPDGTYSIISVTNVMAIEQTRDSDTNAVVHP